MAFLNSEQLWSFGFGHIGKGVLMSEKASIYNASNIFLGDGCRIDDFCILSAGGGGIHVGKLVHIAAYSCLVGDEAIFLSDFSGISSRVSIYSSSDDYSGEFMAHPTVPQQFRRVDSRAVFLGKHVIIGSGSVILPGAKLNDGVAVGALSLVLGREYERFTIFAGIPVKRLKERKDCLLNFENSVNEFAPL